MSQPTAIKEILGMRADIHLRNRPMWLLLLMAAFWVVSLSTLYPAVAGAEAIRTEAPPRPATGQATLDLFLVDVGQGDCMLIRSPTGKVVLVDSGSRQAAPEILELLSILGIDAIDLAIASHAHEDHIGAMREILKEVPFRRFMDPGHPHTSSTYQHLLEALNEQQVPYVKARRGQRIELGGDATLNVLAPESPPITTSRSDVNANSVVLSLSLGNFVALLPGDAERETEERLLAQGRTGTSLRASLLKVAHHGSRFASRDTLLDQIQPSVALISVGKDNNYGHPDPETLARLEVRRIEVFRTDEVGTVRVRTDGRWMWIDATGPPMDGPNGKNQRVFHPTPLAVHATTERPPLSRRPPEALAQTTEDAHAPPPVDANTLETDGPSAPFVASMTSPVFHKAGCGHAQRIAEQNLQTFPAREAAIEAGKRPAKCCHP